MTVGEISLKGPEFYSTDGSLLRRTEFVFHYHHDLSDYIAHVTPAQELQIDRRLHTETRRQSAINDPGQGDAHRRGPT